MKISEQEKLVVKLLSETAKMVEPAIVRYTRISDSNLQVIIDHVMKPKGNRERPLLIRLSCEAVGGNFIDIVPTAVAVELLHFSTLIIDDVLDEAHSRGHNKTVQTVYGYKKAIIIAELLNSLAFLALIDVLNYCNDKHKFLEIIKLFKKTQKDLYLGQYLDLYFEHNEKISEKNYIDMVSKTTSSLIKCSLMTGAILGGGNKDQIEKLTKYGIFLGIAFQIRDDVVEIIGDPQVIGKKLGGDIKQRKLRLPLIYALSNANRSGKHFLRKLLNKRKVTDKNISKTIEILIKSGSIEYSKKTINNYCKKAIEHLRTFPNSWAKNALIAFAEVIALSW